MAYKTMYPAINNSPITALTSDITESDTCIEVDSISSLPTAPNIATIGTDENAELILYTGISGSKLTGCTRGFNGTKADAWAAETKIYRAFTAYDHDTFKANIEEIILKGTVGSQGPQGEKGERGEKGDKGDPGAKGEKGDKGDPGKDGSPGATGVTPRFTITAVTGAAGTAASVTQSGTAENPMVEFTIPQGEKGDPGKNGEPGATGPQGPQGIKGDTGEKGDKGDTGAQGAQGAQGEPGAKGDKGDPGAKGEKGDKGDPGKDAPQEAVLHTAQTLNNAQKTQARQNIGAADEETINQLKDDKVNQSDALTLEEIMASTDLSKKVASAEAVKSIKNAIGSIKSGSFYAEKSKGNTVPVDYGGFIRLSGGSWPGSFYSDTYYVGVGAGSEAFLGVQINGAKQITWVQI